MGSRRSKAEPRRSVPRLYLITPPIDDPATFESTLSTALSAAEVAAVLVRPADAGENALVRAIKRLASPVQSRGAALLLDGRAEIVGKSGADGAHLTGVDGFKDALALLKPQRIAGCGGLRTRHDAMLAGEAGADYTMFGEPENGRRPPLAAVLDRVAWWAELFEIPCVGYAGSFDEIGQLVRAGADFVAVGDLIWEDARGPDAAIRAAAGQLAVRESAQ